MSEELVEEFAVQVTFQKYDDSPKYTYRSSFPVLSGEYVVTPASRKDSLPSVAVVIQSMPWKIFKQNPKIVYLSLIQKVVV